MCLFMHFSDNIHAGNDQNAILFTVLTLVMLNIMKTRLYNVDLLKPHFYIVTGVYRGIHNFSISA